VIAKPVQQEVSSRPDFTEITPVNQTASTVIAQAVQPQEVVQTTVPVMTQDKVVEEEPPPAKEAATNEAATPVAEPVPPQSLAHEPPTPSAEQIVASAAPLKTAPAAKADYGWLMRALLGRIDELKNYPVMARMNRWEGKVVLRAVIKDDGQVLMVDIQESSGRSILDNDAMETLKKASPIKLDQPLGKPQVAILMPISYSLR
jgi:protein TonB